MVLIKVVEVKTFCVTSLDGLEIMRLDMLTQYLRMFKPEAVLERITYRRSKFRVYTSNTRMVEVCVCKDGLPYELLKKS